MFFKLELSQMQKCTSIFLKIRTVPYVNFTEASVLSVALRYRTVRYRTVVKRKLIKTLVSFDKINLTESQRDYLKKNNK